MYDVNREPVQQALLDLDDLRRSEPPPDGRSSILDDRAEVARIRRNAPSKKHFCLQVGLEPGPVAFARVNAALRRFGLPLYPVPRNHAA
jgi:hypothetical protein